MTSSDNIFQRYAGCLLAGAVGDALGGAVEFLSSAEIDKKFGERGITDYTESYGGIGKITDDTQMTLFTAEGLIRAYIRQNEKGICDISSVVSHAYQRWLTTQRRNNSNLNVSMDGWLSSQDALFAQRAPGNTCLTALETMSHFGEFAVNDSKGCGGIMRVAPVALASTWYQTEQPALWAFETAMELCALTHGHPTGQLAGGFFAAFLTLLLNGESKAKALEKSTLLLQQYDRHQEVLLAVLNAAKLADQTPGSRNALPQLGEGWVAEEALAISLYCALSTEDTEEAIILAVNHSGDSDSTGSITGNIMGLLNGADSIPSRWMEELELREVIKTMATDMIDLPRCYHNMWDKYPGH
ncbi:ADP-ribosylglycohydrolase family protein [Spongiibacter sp. KMU-158]|uniref:ADP-ribosylglycohydrolase family protein n=1 Tax=Spongiibacter pelagi TaxID=2760804 RepID=A0A927C548_9GAMM|nr:ADP-ribosylglycohydrolase family protein [Spongiibacter pelagi]MBD2860082.1 ADP-ribosylglycohydrolase family protein [Spongiibacter pelagi]